MKNISKIILVFILYTLYFIVYTSTALAVCPACTVAVCAGVGLSRYLKVDDTISGVWIGGLIISLSTWTIDYLNKRKIKFLFRKPLIVAFYYLLTLLPLYQFKIIGHPLNKYKYFGMDKLLVGIISGSLAFLTGVFLNNLLKIKNGNKAFFPFQKVIIPILFSIILSFIFYKTC